MFFQRVIFLVYLVIVSTSCVSGNCYEKKSRAISQKVLDNSSASVWIYKYTGKIGCSDSGKESTLKSMEKELEGIKVFKSERRHDGLIRIARCGISTGDANVYLIKRDRVDEASERGFHIWDFTDK